MSQETVKFDDWYILNAPKTWAQVYGQDVIVNYLKDKAKKRSFDKSTMLQGQFGSGKTVIAKILAASMACKNVDADGNACGKCPTCAAIFDETYSRDVIYLNGEQMSAQEVDDILDNVFLTPAIRDGARVLICDETQGFSSQAIQKFLSVTQSPKTGVYFIFTAMSKLAGKNPGALQSRCKVWKMKTPKNEEIYQYLANICMSKKLNITKDFATKGLEFIAENSESSFRKAIQLLQQCYEGKIFEIDKIKETFDIVSYDDASMILADLSNGKITESVYKAVVGNDYQDKFGLLLKIIGDASVIKTFGKIYIDESEHWKWKFPQQVADGQYFYQLCEIFSKLAQTAYLKRGDWEIAISKFLFDIKNSKENLPSPGITNVVKRRPA